MLGKGGRFVSARRRMLPKYEVWGLECLVFGFRVQSLNFGELRVYARVGSYGSISSREIAWETSNRMKRMATSGATQLDISATFLS
jgi:hypothetical protein